MSQKTTRASAREIRRAFGPAAVAHLDALSASVEKLVGVVDAQQRAFDRLAARLDDAEQALKDLRIEVVCPTR